MDRKTIRDRGLTGDRHRILEPKANDLRGVDDARLHQVDLLAGGRIEAEVASSLTHLLDHHTAIDVGIRRDLTCGHLQSPTENQRTGPT